MSKESIIESAIQRYVDENGGFQFYADRVDRESSKITNDGLIILYRKGSREQIASYHIEELELAGSRQISRATQRLKRSRIDEEFVNIDLSGDSRKVAGLITSALLLVGALSPIVTLPIMGSINYVYDGRGDGIIIIGLAAASAFLSLTGRYSQLRATGFLSLIIIFSTLHGFRIRIGAIKSQMDEELFGNPFRGLADAAVASVRLEWGWALLIGSSITLIVLSLVVPTEKGLKLPQYAVRINFSEYMHSIPILVGLAVLAGILLGQVIHTTQILGLV